MSAAVETAENIVPLTKVDSAISGLSSSPPDSKKIGHRRTSSSISGVYKPEELEKNGQDLSIAIETQHLGWKMNTSPTQVEDRTVLDKMLCTPPVKKMDLVFFVGDAEGQTVTARNMHGVTIKDALNAIYKACKKRTDDEMPSPYLKGFEWDKEESWTRFKIHQKKESGGAVMAPTSKKAKKKEEKEAAKLAGGAEA